MYKHRKRRQSYITYIFVKICWCICLEALWLFTKLEKSEIVHFIVKYEYVK